MAIITAEDNEASVLTEQLMREDNGGAATDQKTRMHVGGMLTSGVDVIIVLGSIDLGADDDDLLPLTLDIQVTADVGPIGVAIPKGDQSDLYPAVCYRQDHGRDSHRLHVGPDLDEGCVRPIRGCRTTPESRCPT